MALSVFANLFCLNVCGKTWLFLSHRSVLDSRRRLHRKLCV